MAQLPTLTLTAHFAGGDADITAYLRNSGFSLTRGSTSPSLTGLIADQGTFSCVLDNEDRTFDPLNASGAYFGDLVPGVPITLTATWNAVTYTLFNGSVSGWPQTYPAQGVDQTVQIQATDRVRNLSRVQLLAEQFHKAFTGTRISEVLTACGLTAPEMDLDPGTTRMASALEGSTKSSAWGMVADAAAAEWGAVWVRADGVVAFLDRNGIATNTGSLTSQATFAGPKGSDLPMVDAVVAYDDSRIVNDAIWSWNELNDTVTAEDLTSQAQPWGKVSWQGNSQAYVQSITLALGYIQWVIYRYKTPTTRVDQLVIKPQAAPTTVWPKVLDLDLMDRITVKITPAHGTGGQISKDVYIRAINHEYADQLWTTTYTLDDADWTSVVKHYDDGTKYDDVDALYAF